MNRAGYWPWRQGWQGEVSGCIHPTFSYHREPGDESAFAKASTRRVVAPFLTMTAAKNDDTR
ncbi:MAG: hypothetical protein ABI273_02540 [Lacunisphaera sp.]